MIKVDWSQPPPAFLDNGAAVYDHIRKAPVTKRRSRQGSRHSRPRFQSAPPVVEAEYEWPFQSHASMGPGCGVVNQG